MSDTALSGATTSRAADGVIHDLGYRGYDGVRLGRGYAAGSLYTHSLRGAFGLGRGAKAKIFPWFVGGVALLVAVIAAVIRSRTGEVAIRYVEFSDVLSLFLLLFLAVVAPDLVSRDLHSGSLALYFSRPLRRGDYAVVKLLALVSATWLLFGVPQLLMYAVAAFSMDGGPKARWEELLDLSGGLLYTGVYAAVTAPVSLLVASLCRRRAYAAGAVVAVFLVTTPVTGVLLAVGGPTAKRLSGLANPSSLVQGVRQWLFERLEGDLDIGRFGPVYGAVAAALVMVCVGLLLVRYRKVGA